MGTPTDVPVPRKVNVRASCGIALLYQRDVTLRSVWRSAALPAKKSRAMSITLDETILAELRRHARGADEAPRWPEPSWQALRRLGALRWAIPAAFGGDGL